MSAGIPPELISRYDDLKQTIITNALYPPEAYEKRLYALKCTFGPEIRSVRQLDAAEDVDTIIHLLEKRLLLGWFDVDRLLKIMHAFDMPEDGSTFQDYCDYRDRLAQYKIKNRRAFMFPPYDPNIFCEINSNREVIPSHIIDYICSQMKDDWYAFAQELIRAELLVEGQFDKLRRANDLSNEEKTRTLLEIFVKGDKRSKRSRLLQIFRAIRRNDIDEEVDKMFNEAAH